MKFRAKYAGIAVAACAAIGTFTASQTRAGDSGTVGVVSHLNVVSDKSQDISTLEAWKKRLSASYCHSSSL